MRNKELIKKFMEDNFDLTAFDIKWEHEWIVSLYDIEGNRLTIMTFDPTELWTTINGVKYLSYRLQDNNWIVVPNRENE